MRSLPSRCAITRLLAALLTTMVLVSVANAQDVSARSLSVADGRLLALKMSVSFCLRESPAEGKLLRAAWEAWEKSHASQAREFREHLEANPEDVADVRKQYEEYLKNSIAVSKRAAYCANATNRVRSFGEPLDPGQAAGMYYSNILRAEALAEACTRLHPSISDDISRDERKWETDDAAIREFTLARVEARSKQADSPVQAIATETKRLWTSKVEKAESSGEGEKYCRQAFAELAAGKLRSATPDVYEALDLAVDKH